MRLVLKNVGMIKEAEVKLDGLTVIAGENDTGKSTVGKTLFSIIKAAEINRGSFFYSVRNRKVLNDFDDFKTSLTFILKSKKEYDKLATFINEQKIEVQKILENRTIPNNEKQKQIEFVFNRYEKHFKEVIEFYRTLKKKVLDVFKDQYRENFRKGILNKIINYLFDWDIINKKSDEAKVILESLSKRTEILLRKNEVVYFKDGGKIFSDATYIESPVIFQLIDLLSDEDIISKEYIPTIKDLKKKLTGLDYRIDDYELIEKFNAVIKEIEKIINGELLVKNGKFEFKRGEEEYSIKNTATGIKSFGILMMLLKKKWLLKDSVLILDEPEVHLHPYWQIKYAEIIINLVKTGMFKVVVNSHSPYIIQSFIKFYDKSFSLNFYLAKQGNFENVNDNIEKIFQTLSEPLDRIF
ncbi:AAA family ATPase [Caminibacter sp.]